MTELTTIFDVNTLYPYPFEPSAELLEALASEFAARRITAEYFRALEEKLTQRAEKPREVKRGVWIDGKLRLQTRDSEAIDSFAAKALADKRNSSVWVAPVGCFQEH